jgi:hypothetical protein
MAHNTQQHKAEAQWARADLGVHRGVASPSEIEKDSGKEFDSLSAQFFQRKEMTIEEAEIKGAEFFRQAFEDWQNGVKERHPTRAEVKMINEECS